MNLISGQNPFTPLEVIDKATGEKIVIKDYRFDSSRHEVVGTGGGKVEIKEEKKEAAEPVEELSPAQKARFEELKAKKWKNLSADERKEYSALKPSK